MIRALGSVLLVGLSACSWSDDDSPRQDSSPEQATGMLQPTGALQEDLDLQASDFGCIESWDKVRSFRITNKLGHQQEALAVAQNPGSGPYPVGTVIQIVPVEAMVKRRAGFNPDAGDWEFFLLDVNEAGTTINMRGARDVVGPGGNCQDCHGKAAPRWDYICEMDHGCDTIPVDDAFLQGLQDTDPRCPQ
jgi:hypothetical protein